MREAPILPLLPSDASRFWRQVEPGPGCWRWVGAVARKDDAATRQIANLQRQASTDYVGSTVTLSSTYATYSQIFNQDPTAADWTPTTVNADEFGIKEIA